MEKVIREFVPPILWRIVRNIRRQFSNEDSKWKYGAEQPPAYYDERFRLRSHWRQHYTKSRYYSLWAIIADRIQQMKPAMILDIGCGSGQFANLLYDKGIANYVGVDFSPSRIAWARQICPKYRFEIKDVLNSTLIEDINADCVVLLEFLEHVERDVLVLEKIQEGACVIASVPNFPGIGHVRYFNSVTEVEDRYHPYFKVMQIDEHLTKDTEKKYYLIQGIC